MPGVWNTDDFVEGGLASIEEFIGRLTDIDEDVEGKFGNQLALHFHDVEIVTAGDDVTLDEGRFTCWVKQSNRKNSVNSMMVADMVEFAKAHDMGPVPSCFENVLIRWRKATYEFGDDVNPGRAMIPVELMEEGGSKKKAKPAASKAEAEPAEPAAESEEESGSDVPEALDTAIREIIGENGATREMIRRGIQKKAALRKALTEAGSLDDVLAAMDNLDEDDGTYTLIGEDDPV